MPGSMDDDPPVIIGSDEYDFALIVKPVGVQLYRSSVNRLIDRPEVVARLREIADAIEQSYA